jgi:hypothetical protein
MKALVALAKILSFPLILLGGGLCYWGIHHWKLGTADLNVDGRALPGQRPDAALFRDSVRYDLSQASIRQDNFLGIKSPARAVFPVWAGSDTGASHLVAVSSDPRFLGPVVQSFQRVDSSAGEIKVKSNQSSLAGNLQSQFDALLQILAVQLKDHLHDTLRGRALIRGPALRLDDTASEGVGGLAPEFWEIRTEGVPSSDSVYAAVFGGIVCIAVGMGLQVATGRWERRRREEEEEERQNEQPLV